MGVALLHTCHTGIVQYLTVPAVEHFIVLLYRTWYNKFVS